MPQDSVLQNTVIKCVDTLVKSISSEFVFLFPASSITFFKKHPKVLPERQLLGVR